MDESEGMRKREIIQPDFLFQRATGAYLGDVKTISFTTSNYGGRKRTEPHLAVNTRARKVHKEYLNKAKAADRKWNNTPQNAVGPIELRLNEFGAVRPFVFGFLGETNNANSPLAHLAPYIDDCQMVRLRQHLRLQVNPRVLAPPGALRQTPDQD